MKGKHIYFLIHISFLFISLHSLTLHLKTLLLFLFHNLPPCLSFLYISFNNLVFLCLMAHIKPMLFSQYKGGCLYVPPGIFKSTCKIDITWFPCDEQLCIWSLVPGHILGGRWVYCSVTMQFVGWCTSFIQYVMWWRRWAGFR